MHVCVETRLSYFCDHLKYVQKNAVIVLSNVQIPLNGVYRRLIHVI
jgi:hypothetical protein